MRDCTSGAWTVALACVLLIGPAANEGLAQQELESLKRMPLEELMAVDVTTVSRLPGPAMEVPAAVHVITRDDIRRSGATTLPEALRLAPGVQISRIDSARYAVGIRGFADRLARSTLVMIDGRAVYNPLFAGTYWETQHVFLEDIERIEVIRGPGGTLWGANAVNGIINIITRSADDTVGTVVTGRAGMYALGPMGVRYGAAPGEDLSFRTYAQVFRRDAFSDAGLDDWHMMQGGFRTDWTPGQSRSLTVQGDIYTGQLEQRYNAPLDRPPFSQTITRDAPVSGGNVLARWTSNRRADRGVQIQAYYDRTSRDERPVAETRDTFDIDLQVMRPVGSRHRVAWGGGYRTSTGRIRAVAPSFFEPEGRTDQLFTAFVEDTVTIVADRLRATVGTKVEHNAYSSFEIQPAARLLFTIDSDNVLMASVTRGVRTPSRVETDYGTTSVADAAVPSFVRLLPNPSFDAEELIAYEIGYRSRPMSSLYITTATFFNSVDNILSTELLTPVVETAPFQRLILPVTFANGLRGNAYGAELTADWRPSLWWRSTAHYSYARIQLTKKEGSNDVSQELRNERLNPRHQVHVQSAIDLPRQLQFDWTLRYVSPLRVGAAPGYTTSDLRLSWQPRPAVEVAIVGQDLHEAGHIEWAESTVPVPRRVYLSLTVRR